MFCHNCGAEVDTDRAFCDACGAKIKIDGVIQAGAVSENTVPNPQGAQGQVAQSKYLITAGVIVVVTVVAIMSAFLYKPSHRLYHNENYEYSGVNYDEDNNASQYPGSAESTQIDEESTSDSYDVDDYSEYAGSDEYQESVYEDTDSEENEMSEDTSIHNYELVVKDISWSDAYQEALDKGGYLVRINSEEELNVITAQIESEDKQNIIFFIGAFRENESSDYHWIYENGEYGEESLNNDEKYEGIWLDGEPSYQGEDTEGNLVGENCLDMFYSKSNERYVWNDVPDIILDVAPFYEGKVGYIREYEDGASDYNSEIERSDLDNIVGDIRSVYYDFTGNPRDYDESYDGEYTIYRLTDSGEIRCIKCSSKNYSQFSDLDEYFVEYYYDKNELCFVFVYSSDGTEEYRFYIYDDNIVRYIGPYSSPDTTYDYFPPNRHELGDDQNVWQSQFVELGMDARNYFR